MNKNWINNPVFVVGHPKSGTSLMNSLLDSHPELMVIPEETDYYHFIWPKTHLLNLQWRLNKREKNKMVLNNIIEKSHFKNYFRGNVENDISGNLNYKDLDIVGLKDKIGNVIESMNIFNRKNLFIGLVEAYFNVAYEQDKSKKIKYWVEKTPNHIHYLNKIITDFPKAKFIYIYRDPRDNFVSYKKKRKYLSSIDFSKNWIESFDLIEKIDQNNVIKIKYEDLIYKTDTEINRVISFLNINTSKELFIPSKNGKNWMGNSMFGDSSKNIRSSSIGRFKKHISVEDLEIIETLCFDKMKSNDFSIKKELSLSDIKNFKKNNVKYTFYTKHILPQKRWLKKILIECKILLFGKG